MENLSSQSSSDEENVGQDDIFIKRKESVTDEAVKLIETLLSEGLDQKALAMDCNMLIMRLRFSQLELRIKMLLFETSQHNVPLLRDMAHLFKTIEEIEPCFRYEMERAGAANRDLDKFLFGLQQNKKGRQAAAARNAAKAETEGARLNATYDLWMEM